LAQINRKAIAMLAELRREWQSEATPIVISGCIGPRGDGYQVGDTMTADEARRYHQEQIDTFSTVLNTGEAWIQRIRAVRANASTKSHAELDEATELDSGDIQALADHYAKLRSMLPRLNVFGGCCGTDHRHVRKIAASVLQAA
jgi:S-methylmethionine-dependent homocysteine/selenocysteine methylase